MMHIAMFEAINSIERVYTPYRVQISGSRGASPEAAAAQAARDVLTALYPTQQATFDAALAVQLASIPPGLARQGRAIGRQAAQAVLEWRTDDGWPSGITPDAAYVLPPFPGLWQPTPPVNSFATFTFFPNVVPFAMLTSTQYLPPSPPTLTSARYAQDLNETQLLGSATSAARTAEETLMSQVFAGVNTTIGFFHVWNMVAAIAAQDEGSRSPIRRACSCSSMWVSDGMQTSFTSNRVRILAAGDAVIVGQDLNPYTTADAT